MQVVVPWFTYAFFTTENYFRLLTDVSSLLEHVSTDTGSRNSHLARSGETGSEPRYPPPYRLEDYIRLRIPKLDARRLTILPTWDVFVIHSVVKQ